MAVNGIRKLSFGYEKGCLLDCLDWVPNRGACIDACFDWWRDAFAFGFTL